MIIQKHKEIEKRLDRFNYQFGMASCGFTNTFENKYYMSKK